MPVTFLTNEDKAELEKQIEDVEADIPTKVSELENDKKYLSEVPSGYAKTDDHYSKTESDNKYQPKGNYLTKHQDLSEYQKTTEADSKYQPKGSYEASGTAESKVNAHNVATDSHNDIRLLIQGLTTRLNAFLDTDDTTLDQMSELVAYINSNKSLIDSITTTKVNVSDIVDNLTTSVSNKPLSAKQAVVLKGLIDTLQSSLNSHTADTTKHITASERQSWNAKSNFSGSYKDLTNVPTEFKPADHDHTDYEDEISSLKESIVDLSGGEIPDYWQSHIDSKISTIKALQDEAGKEGFTFVVMTDIHYPSNSKNSPILAKKIMDECNIKYAMVLGDLQNRGSHGTKENALNEWVNIKEMFKPIYESILFQKGNHDGSWGNTLNSVTYPYNFTPSEMYNRVYAPTYRFHNVITDESETGYYVDDTSRKVRYIMLNSHCNSYEENTDGSAKYSNMKNFRFTQSQYDMVIDALTSLKELWSVVVLAHVPIVEAYQEAWGGANSDFIVMRNLLKAYKNKTSYAASWNGTNGYDKVSVNVDFENAKGEFIGYFSGHMHNDYTYKSSDGYGIDIITVRCDGKEENGSLLDERVDGTITEQCFDVFTVNTKSSTIYGTRIGAGSDRIISIGGVVIPTYTIINTLTNCTNSNGSSVIEKNKSYTATISAKSGYQLQSVKVTMSDTDITSTVYSNGVINIANVTGNIVITASAKADTYTVTNNLTGCTTSNSVSSITHGNSYTATITANTDHELETVTVTMGGVNITSSAYNNGVINISSVTGNIVITATAIEVGGYVNLFDKSGTGFTDSGTKFYTNWIPYNANDNGGNGTIYHFKGLAVPTYPNPYKMQFKTSSGTTSAQVYCNTANVQAHVKASYDNSVILIQHDTNSTDYKSVQFEIREAVPSNLIITANQDIID